MIMCISMSLRNYSKTYDRDLISKDTLLELKWKLLDRINLFKG